MEKSFPESVLSALSLLKNRRLSIVAGGIIIGAGGSSSLSRVFELRLAVAIVFVFLGVGVATAITPCSPECRPAHRR